MKKRIIAALLAVLMLGSMLPSTVLAASSEEEALGEVDIYHNGVELSYLAMYGYVWKMTYTYYNYRTSSGETMEIPAYCVNPDTAGVPNVVPAGGSVKYIANELASDPKVAGIVANGYPKRGLEELGVETKEQAYYATKMALWTYLIPTWNIDYMTVNPALSGAELTRAEKILAATREIYARGTTWNELMSAKLTTSVDQEIAYPVTIDGTQYKQQVFTVTSETWVRNYDVAVSFAVPDDVPAGTRIVDMDNRDITSVRTEAAGNGYSGQFKVLYPMSSVEGRGGSVQLSLSADVYQYAIFYAVCAEYGNLQNYICDTDPSKEMRVSAISNYSDSGIITPDPDDPDDPEPDTPVTPTGTRLKIVKLEEGTNTPLEGAVFSVYDPQGRELGSYSTNASGEITIPVTLAGHYTVTEEIPPKYHLLPDVRTQHAEVEYAKTSTVTFWDAPYGNLRVYKVSDTGDKLDGVTIQIKNTVTGETRTGTTTMGVVSFTELTPGAWEVTETAGIEGWLADATSQNVVVVSGETSECTIVNKELPGLRIVKYDRNSHTAMAGVTFAVYKDGEFLGNFVTNQLGEILITNAAPGTYLCYEVNTGDDGHILDTTPQEIELKAGDGIKELLFFNDVKPGIHLIKLDSVTMKAIPNVRFQFKQVGGSYTQELVTDANGEIDLSKLDPGTYEVRELEAPEGYLMDDSVRIIKLEANKDASFVFTNTPKPSLVVAKYDSNTGKYLAGATFRIAKIEDGTHYLDRVTDTDGRISIAGLEPGVYSVKEIAAPAGYILNDTEYHVELFPGKTSTLVVENKAKPDLKIVKTDAVTGEPVEGVTFTLKKVDGSTITTEATNAKGEIIIEDLDPGVYEITEQSVPDGYLLNPIPQKITLVPNKLGVVRFQNYPKPTLTIKKIDSATGKPVEGARFHVIYASNHTFTGEINDLGEYYTDADGIIKLDKLRDGWYQVTEVKAPAGYRIQGSGVQECYVAAGKDKVLIFENVPLSTILIQKMDEETGKPLPGAWFRLRYLNAMTSMDGTTLGEYVTDENGQIEITNLDEGTYIVEEISAPAGYVLSSETTRTVYLSGENQDFITITYGNQKMGSLLIVKKDSLTGAPLSGVEFFVTDSDGAVVGNGNGKFTTDFAGSILITNLEPGKTIVAKETRTVSGYVLDDAPQTVKIKANETVTLEFRNAPKGTLIVQKIDSATGKPLPGAEFKITAANGELTADNEGLTSSNGIYRTDSNGQVVLEKLTPGTYVVTETKAPDGYELTAQPQTVVVNPGDTQTLTFGNPPKGSLIVQKYDKVSGQPLPGAEFKIVTASGELVADNEGLTSTNGMYVTDENGQIVLSKLNSGTYVVTETKAPDGYQLDPTPQTVVVNTNDTQTLKFYDEPLASLTIIKRDVDTKELLSGAAFAVKDGAGKLVGGEKQYVTGSDGTVTVTGLAPNSTVVVSEETPPAGYWNGSDLQTIILQSGAANSVTFENRKLGTLIIRKFIEGTNNEPLKGVAFRVTSSDGTEVGPDGGVYYTDAKGEIVLNDLQPDITVKAHEIKTVDGFILDGTPQDVKIIGGQTQQLTFWNSPEQTLTVQKYIEGTTTPIEGVIFLITDSSGAVLGTNNGEFTTDRNGRIVLTGLKPGTTVTAKEIKTVSGFVLDGTPQSILIKEGEAQTMTFYNERKGGLIIEKRDSVTNQPLAGAEFKITTLDGKYVDDNEGQTSTKGVYRTDSNGQIVLTNLQPDSYVIREIKAPDGYVLTTEEQSVKVNANDTQTITFLNEPLCSLTLTKLDSVTGKPVPGTVFKVTDGNGNLIGTYTTGQDGTVTVTGLIPGSTVVVTEIKVPAGYVLNPKPQTITVKNGANTVTNGSSGNNAGGNSNGNGLTFENDPATTLVIEKYVTGTTTPLKGVTFLVTDSSGAVVGNANGEFITDENGRIVIEGLEPGMTVTVRETKTLEGFILDTTPKTIKIKAGEEQTLRFYNQPQGTLVIQKLDSITKQPLAGAEFQLTYANGSYVDNDNGHLSSNGLYTTDANGEIRISGVIGTIVVKEVKAAPGYVVDQSTQTQTVAVNSDDTQTLVFLNEPLCSLTITKVDSVTGKPVPGTVFKVTDTNGNLIGTYTTGQDGTVTVTGLIPGSTVVVSEIKVPSGYVLNPTPQTITVRNGANTVSSGVVGGSSGGTGTGTSSSSNGNGLTFENDPTMNLTIHKYIEGTANEPLSGVAFKITDGSGAPVGPGDGVFYTDAAGEIVVEGLEPGTTVTVREIKTVEGFVLDGTPKTIRIKAGETAPELTFWNKRAGELVIRKLDSVTKQPLAGVEFELTYAGGGYVDNANGHLSSNGLYTTDSHGEIHISGVTGTIVAKETRTIPGYTIDESTRIQTVVVRPEDTQTLVFYNDPIVTQTLTIQKYIDGTTDPIEGVTFLVTDSSGAVVGPNNGEYVTDQNGRIVIADLTPGVTITARETKTVSGYVLDITPQSILIKEGEAQTLTFFNSPNGGLELIKVSESDKTRRIPNTTFEIRKMDGALVETVTTDKNGRVHVNLAAGNYYAVEIEAAQGFKLDSTPNYFTVEDGKTTTLTVKNKPFSGILIHKIDSVTREGIYGAVFLLYDANKNPIGQYTSDNKGYVYIEELSTSGRYYIRELENEGYVVDEQLKTVYVTAGTTTEIQWENTPITGQIQITKTSADYNSMNGWPAGTPIPGTVFEIYNYKSGNLVDTIQTDKNGAASSRPLPLGRYKIIESKAADFYGLDKTPIEVEIEFAGQIVKAAMTNKSLYTNVSIRKTGYSEVMPGQMIRYDFSEIANNSTTALTSFYWRDTLPAEVRLQKIVTGTYNVSGNYKIVYRTNLSGGSYRTLADNLSATQNYVLDSSSAALGLASNEYVTEFMVSFGIVPANFRQVEAPAVYCSVVTWLTGGTQFVNQADIGGVYNGQWIMAVARWVTNVYKPAEPSLPLPRTGY